MTRMILDASDFARVAAVFDRMPRQIQTVAFRRASARMRAVVARHYARFASQQIKLPQKHITKRMRSALVGGDVELIVRSNFIPLDEIGAQQRGYGVFVRGRGRYEGAFIPNARARRAAGLVLKRVGTKRLPTEMLFGPNPAHAVTRTPARYEVMLGDLAKGEFASVVMQQIEFLIARA